MIIQQHQSQQTGTPQPVRPYSLSLLVADRVTIDEPEDFRMNYAPSTLHRITLAAGLGLTSLVWAGTGSVNDPVPGWASQNGGTTGGKGGTEVTVTTMANLQKYAKDTKPFTIWVSGTLGSYGVRGNGNGDRVVVAANKSILGLPGAVVNGGFDIKGVSNIILRNLTVQGPGAVDNDGGTAGEGRQDNITIISGASNIWLDHLDVRDGEDGNTDITKSSNFVTVSWTKFSYTDKSYVSGVTGYSHRFCNLIGGSDTEGSDGKLNITFYKSWWSTGVAERMPRVRFGKLHIVNSLFTSTDPGQTHCVRAGFKADLLVESNVFVGQKKPIDLFDGDYTAVTVKNNLFTGCTGNTLGKGTSFTPPYSLALTDATKLQAEVGDASNGSGATLKWITTAVSPRRVGVPPLRLDRGNGTWKLANATDSQVRYQILSPAGTHLGDAVTVPAHSSLELPIASSIRLLQVTGSSGVQTLTIPGF